MAAVWKRSKGPPSVIRGIGISATTKGAGCVASHCTMAGRGIAKGRAGERVRGVLAQQQRPHDHGGARRHVAAIGARPGARTRCRRRTASASVVRIMKRDGTRMKVKPGQVRTHCHRCQRAIDEERQADECDQGVEPRVAPQGAPVRAVDVVAR